MGMFVYLPWYFAHEDVNLGLQGHQHKMHIRAYS